MRARGSTSRPFLEASSDTFLLIDGAERLGTFQWRRLQRRARRLGGLVITSHAVGRLPTLIECTTSLELLRGLVRELAPNELPAVEPMLGGLFERHAGNLRLCLRELYDLAAGRSA
jgi:hypothetical protein